MGVEFWRRGRLENTMGPKAFRAFVGRTAHVEEGMSLAEVASIRNRVIVGQGIWIVTSW